MPEPIVLVGGGLASGTAAKALREQGYDGPLVLLADEPHLPYERPPLSKDLLLGKASPEDALVASADWWGEHDVEVRTGSPVTSLDPAAHSVTVDEQELRYRALLLATGSRARHLPMADASGLPVHHLRTLDDSAALGATLVEGSRIGIIGAGWIGLEVASAARQRGAEVVVLETLAQPLERVVGAEVGALFAQLHREHGVDLRTGVQVESISRDGITLAGDDHVEVDQLVVGIGVTPVTDLAEAAGLAVENGILVDSQLRTSAPDVLAAGDVAAVDHPLLGRLRVEHWDTAIKHGTVAANNLLGGDAVADELPYFFTDQYALGLEYVGHPGAEGFDSVEIEGDDTGPVDQRVLRVWWRRAGRLVAGMHVNDWDAIDEIRTRVREAAQA